MPWHHKSPNGHTEDLIRRRRCGTAESSVRPGGYKGGPQEDLSLEDLSTSVQEVKDKVASGGPSLPNPFVSKGNPGQEQRTDQLLEPQGPAAEAQRSADQQALSTSDEKRIDRDT